MKFEGVCGNNASACEGGVYDCEAEIKGEGCEVALNISLVVRAYCKLAYHKWCNGMLGGLLDHDHTDIVFNIV